MSYRATRKGFLISCSLSLAVTAQVQLQFASQPFGQGEATYTYTGAVQLPTNDVVLIGWSNTPSRIGLYSSPVQHSEIAFASFGPVPFQNGEPPDALPVLGGSGNDQTQAAAVDPSGNIWIIGNTDSDDFNLLNPIVSQKVPYRTAGFVIELDPTGTKMLFATYLAGQQRPPYAFCTLCLYASYATVIAVDQSGAVYVGGYTNEADFPTTPGAFMRAPNGIGASPFGDSFFYSFLLKVSPAGKLVYSTLLGTGQSGCSGGSACIGHSSTIATITSMAVDGSGVATVAGIKSGSYNLGSGYVSRVAADGSKLLWSASPGSSYGAVTGLTMAQDSTTNVYVFGTYVTPIFLLSGYPEQAGSAGLFAAKLKADGSTTIYSVDLGPSPDSRAAGITLDASGNPYMAGTSSSPQFPNVPNIPNLGADFVLSLDASGAKPQALFRFPRGAIDVPPIFDRSGDLLLLANTGALLTLAPNYDFKTPAIVAIGNSASYALNQTLAPGELVSLFGFDLDGSIQNIQVYMSNVPATVLYASPNQINVQVPFEVSPLGPNALRIVVPSGTVTLDAPSSFPSSLGIFTSDGVHAAALNQDGTANSSSNPALRGSIVTLFGTGAIWSSGIQDGAVASSAIPFDQALNQFEVVDAIGTPASILHAGTAPGIIYGVFQLNVQLSPDVAPPLTVRRLDRGLSSNAVQVYLK